VDSSNQVTIGLIQMSCSENPKDNFEKASQLIREASERDAQIICLQELFQTPYFPQVKDKNYLKLAEEVSEKNPNIQRLMQLAKEKKVVIIGGFFEEAGEDQYFNTAVCIDADGKYLGKYRKMHIPEDPQFHEKFYFEKGDLGFKVFKTKYANIGILICWDQWFPEAARKTVLKGADILFYPTAIGWLPEEKEKIGKAQHDAWRTIQRSHAIANGCFIASVNRVGFEKHPKEKGKGIEFWGGSFLTDPFGQLLDVAPSDEEVILISQLNLSKIKSTREEWPFLRDLRADDYES